MSLHLKWKITNIKTKNDNNLENIVSEINWDVVAVDETGVEGTYNGFTQFDTTKVNIEQFTNFENLSEEQVVGWITSNISEHLMIFISEFIQKEINDKKTPATNKQLPWST